MHIDERLSRVTAVKALRVIEVIRQIARPVMIISAEKEYLTVSVGSGNKGGVNSYDIVRWDRRRPWHIDLRSLLVA
jgi:hypothetical protein